MWLHKYAHPCRAWDKTVNRSNWNVCEWESAHICHHLKFLLRPYQTTHTLLPFTTVTLSDGQIKLVLCLWPDLTQSLHASVKIKFIAAGLLREAEQAAVVMWATTEALCTCVLFLCSEKTKTKKRKCGPVSGCWGDGRMDCLFSEKNLLETTNLLKNTTFANQALA